MVSARLHRPSDSSAPAAARRSLRGEIRLVAGAGAERGEGAARAGSEGPAGGARRPNHGVLVGVAEGVWLGAGGDALKKASEGMHRSCPLRRSSCNIVGSKWLRTVTAIPLPGLASRAL